MGYGLVGSAVLTVLSASEQQFGFLLLEGCWALVSAGGLAQRRGRGSAAAPAGEAGCD